MGNQAIVVVDLGFGDAGKGTMVDALARKHDAKMVVRFNGGAQAAHNVVLSDGRHHTFSQFGSAMLIPGVQTVLSRFMFVDPLAMEREAEVLASKCRVHDAFARTVVDGRALVITRYAFAMNRLREYARGSGRHGSCGIGVGETAAYAANPHHEPLQVQDLISGIVVETKLEVQRIFFKCALAEIYEKPPEDPGMRKLYDLFFSRLSSSTHASELTRAGFRMNVRRHLSENAGLTDIAAHKGTVIFEGAQGVLIDEWHGFHPYTTWSTCTDRNAMTLLDECGYPGNVKKFGVLRAYTVRHGVGPFPSQDASYVDGLAEWHNVYNPWQQNMRAGYFDGILHRYAHNVCTSKFDGLMVSHLDTVAQWDEQVTVSGYTGREEVVKLREFGRVEDGGILRDLYADPNRRDLVYQEKLGGVLGRVCCGVDIDRTDALSYAHKIASQLDLPLVAVSRGPTELDKEFY